MEINETNLFSKFHRNSRGVDRNSTHSQIFEIPPFIKKAKTDGKILSDRKTHYYIKNIKQTL